MPGVFRSFYVPLTKHAGDARRRARFRKLWSTHGWADGNLADDAGAKRPNAGRCAGRYSVFERAASAAQLSQCSTAAEAGAIIAARGIRRRAAGAAQQFETIIYHAFVSRRPPLGRARRARRP